VVFAAVLPFRVHPADRGTPDINKRFFAPA
jgi:hypothetical protein